MRAISFNVNFNLPYTSLSAFPTKLLRPQNLAVGSISDLPGRTRLSSADEHRNVVNSPISPHEENSVKLFNIKMGRECQKCCGFELSSVILDKRYRKCVSKYNASKNVLC